MAKRKVSPETSRHLAYDALREGILNGRILPGNWLREQDLVEQLGVSRTPIREALRHLETEGLVEISPYRGARVFVPDPDDIRDEYIVRAALEGLAAELAVRHITDKDVDELRTLSEKADKLLSRGDIDGSLEVNRHFHMKLYRLSGSRRLVSMIEAAWERGNLYRRFFYARPGGVLDEKANHEELLEACRLRDGERARKIMQNSCLASAELISRTNNVA